jgi:phosphatidylglycerol:prolipoprotein diacylglycerol transferase
VRQTLFHIGDEIAGWPLFGFGWLLVAWAISAVLLLGWVWRKHGWSSEFKSYIPILLVMGAIILFLPRLVGPNGLPIRGYGAFMLVGVVAGVATAVYRGKRQGVDPDLLMSLAFWMFVVGIIGARAFFVVQYWQNFQRATVFQTFFQMIKFTEGGLVVYGSLAGGLLAFVLFCRREKLSPLVIGDIIGPSMLLGLALGRIGCLMNGCCYGGVCDRDTVCISFPRYSNPPQNDQFSPPYQDQLVRGQLHGIRIAAEPDGFLEWLTAAMGGRVVAPKVPMIVDVHEAGPAARAGVPVGVQIARLNGIDVATVGDVRSILISRPPELRIESVKGQQYAWSAVGFPDRSLPVQPTQIYSAINAFLLFLTLWLFFPYRWKNGQVIFLTLGLYAISRFVLELIRTDEGGVFGTWLTISQWVSLISILAVLALGVMIHRQPRLVGNATSQVGLSS